jgi:hypothetical protein
MTANGWFFYPNFVPPSFILTNYSPMKKLLLFWMILLGIQSINAQEPAAPSPEPLRRFHVGVSYVHNTTGLKVTGFSAQSIWMGSDLGTITFDDDELSTLNDQRSDVSYLNSLCI